MRSKTKRPKSRNPAQNRLAICLVIVLIVIILSFAILLYRHITLNRADNNGNSTNGKLAAGSIIGFNISSELITPQSYLTSNPVINTSMPLGHNLTDINEPLNSSDLSVINQAPDSYFEYAGELFLNGTYLTSKFYTLYTQVPVFRVNGKPSVIYLGSITCLYCGQNRWAMALALSRFGNFSALYEGYSSFNDGDIPTIYWAPAQYNGSTVDLGSFYSSNYINFIAIEDTAPITGGFYIHPLSIIQQEINSTGNLAYEDAMRFILEINNFDTTPYTIWGAAQLNGADAVDLGNYAVSGNLSKSVFPMTYMTHAQVLEQLQNPDNKFSWGEYAAADLYVAMICNSIQNNASVCDLPAIANIEDVLQNQ